MKEGGAHAVKLEGGDAVVPQVEALVKAGIPVMAHVGFTPQSEHTLGGYRVQGRGDAADRWSRTPARWQEAGAFAVVMEMVPGRRRRAGHRGAHDPDHRHRRRADCDAQVLVWQDMAGLRGGTMARFVKQYADLRGTLLDAAKAYADDVAAGTFPSRGALVQLIGQV